MEVISMEWVDKLFNCMQQFYGERWTKLFSKPHIESMYKKIWQNGLCGLNYDQIKFGLQLCKRASQDETKHPPHVMEFFRYAKGMSHPHITYHIPANQRRGNTDVAKKALADIRNKLNGKISKHDGQIEVYQRLVNS